MRALGVACLVGSAIVWCSAAAAQDTEPSARHDAVLTEARELLKKGEHEAAIELLRPAIDEMTAELAANREDLREAYLLLINTHVQRSNHFYAIAQERQTGHLWRDKAKAVIAQCLETPGLSDTEPNPAQDPPEMVELFEEVRGEIFGTFRVVKLDPPKARVHLDGELLGTGEGLPLERKNLRAGSHVVVVRADGYKDYTEDIDVSPGHTLDFRQALKKKAGKTTWALRTGLVAAAAVGVAALVDGGSGGSSPPTPLPEPPPPPGN